MYGDHPGSPRRDSRQNPGPQSSPDPFGALDAGSPLSGTGYTFGDGGSAFGDTASSLGDTTSPFADTGSAFGGLEPARGTAALTLQEDDRPASSEAEYGDVRVAGRPLGAGPAETPEHGDAGHGELLGSGPAGVRPAGAKAGLLQRPGARKAAVISAAAVVLVGGGGVAMAMAAGSKGSADKESGTVQPAALPDAAKEPKVDAQALDAQRRRLAVQRAAKAARGELRHKPVWKVKGSPVPSPTATPGGGGAPSAGNPAPVGEAQAIAKKLLPSFGFDPDTQFGCLVNLWTRESGWRTNAANPSGAYGIPQALPGVKMAKYGSDWRTNPKTQIKWGLSYIKGRYHTPCLAWAAFQRQGFY